MNATRHHTNRPGHCRRTLVATLVLSLTPALWADETLPSSQRLVGIVRDFSRSHVDFDVSAEFGHGHYAGNVALQTDVLARPILAPGMGFEVDGQWTDTEGQNVPPHLMMSSNGLGGGAAFFVNGTVNITQGAVDSFDSSVGPFPGSTGHDALIVTNASTPGAVTLSNNADVYGDIYVGAGADPNSVIAMDGNCSVTGTKAALAAPFELLEVAAPEGMPASSGDAEISGGVLTGLVHYNDLTIKKNKTVTVVGPTILMCDGDFTMENNCAVELAEGATLELFVAGEFQMYNNTGINEVAHAPSRVTITMLDEGMIGLQNRNRLYASIVAPESLLRVENNAEMGGWFMVGTLTIDNGGSAIHLDRAGASETTCAAYDDDAGVIGRSSDGAIDSEASFTDWFADDPAISLAARRDIVLELDDAGEYRFHDVAFYPIDSSLHGNEGEDHNDCFTYEIRAWSTFESCAGQFIELQGGDGMWLFINGELAIDLGGTQSNTTQYLELDRLGLPDGETLDVRLFYANRNADSAMLWIRTNVLLKTGLVGATVSAPFD